MSKWIYRILLTIFFVPIFSFLFPLFSRFFPLFYNNFCYAQGNNTNISQNFKQVLDITYTFSKSNVTRIDYNVQTTNLTATNYVTDYTFTIPSDSTNISVTGEPNSFTVDSSQANQKNVTINFQNILAGLGVVQSFDLSFDSISYSQFLFNSENILTLPFSTGEKINQTLIVPDSFGGLQYISHQYSSVINNINGNREYIFNNYTNSIHMEFGSYGLSHFTYNYPIDNSSLLPSSYTITIPADTWNQNVSFTNINPTPSTFNINNDGDYILTYNLNGNSKIDVNIQGDIQVESSINLLSSRLKTPVYLSSTETSNLTAQTKYWQTKNPIVYNTAQKLTSNTSGILNKELNIYNYLVNTFKYNYNAINDPNRQRMGAVYALTNPTDVICQEYADTFVALSRAANIPARLVAGYAYSEDSQDTLPDNVLHAWAEFYDPNYGWVPVDPTWGDTTYNYFGNMGLSHFTLVVYGNNDSSPVLVNSFTNTVNPNAVNITQNQGATFDNTININYPSQVNAISGIGNVTINLSNTGSRVLYINNRYVFPTMTIPLTESEQANINVFSLKSSQLSTNVIESVNNFNSKYVFQYPINTLVTYSPLFVFSRIFVTIFIFVLSFFIVMSISFLLIKRRKI